MKDDIEVTIRMRATPRELRSVFDIHSACYWQDGRYPFDFEMLRHAVRNITGAHVNLDETRFQIGPMGPVRYWKVSDDNGWVRLVVAPNEEEARKYGNWVHEVFPDVDNNVLFTFQEST